MVVEHPSSYALIVIITFFLANNYHWLLAPPLHRKECRGDAFFVVNISRIVATRETPKVSKFLFSNLVHRFLLSGINNSRPATGLADTSQVRLMNTLYLAENTVYHRWISSLLPPPSTRGISSFFFNYYHLNRILILCCRLARADGIE